MGCILHGSHGHSHGNTVHLEENINVRAAVIHVLGDLIQSTGVFISALVIKFYVSLLYQTFKIIELIILDITQYYFAAFCQSDRPCMYLYVLRPCDVLNRASAEAERVGAPRMHSPTPGIF